MAKRQESMGGYSETMGELSTLLETQSGQNDKLLSENTELSQHMSKLLEEAQNREKQFETVQTELTLQLKLLEAQLKKAQLEKAEIKCEMTQERMDISKELTLERDRSINLERTVTLLREQLDVYEVCMNNIFCIVIFNDMYVMFRNNPMSCHKEWVTMQNNFNISKHKLIN